MGFAPTAAVPVAFFELSARIFATTHSGNRVWLVAFVTRASPSGKTAMELRPTVRVDFAESGVKSAEAELLPVCNGKPLKFSVAGGALTGSWGR